MKKNICLVQRDLSIINGGVHVAINLANELSRFYNVTLVGILSEKGKKPAYPLKSNVNYLILNEGNLHMSKVLLPSSIQLRKIIKAQKFDAMISIGAVTALFIIFASLFTKTRTIYSEQSNLTNTVGGKKYQKLVKFLSCKCADWTVTLTKEDTETYKKCFHAKKISCIYNWMEDTLVERSKNCSYNPENRRIFSVGRLVQVKGYDMLLDVAERVSIKYPDWSWHIFGEGKLRESLEKQIKDRNLEEWVILRGNDPKVYERYSEAGLYVMTSYHEGMPMVLLEAMAHHLPIVSFDCKTGPKEIINNNVNGFLIPAYDVRNMADKICELLGNRPLREVLASHSMDDVEKFNKNKIVNQWYTLIEKVAERK